MKILEISIPPSSKLGLKAISFARLGQVVILAGRNGAGKSRVLSAVRGHLSEERMPPWNTPINEMPSLLQGIAVQQNGRITNHAEAVQILEQHVPIQFKDLALSVWNSVRLDRIANFKFVWLTPQFPELKDVRELPPSQLEKYSLAARSSAIKDLREHALARIEDLQNQWFHARSPDVTASEEQRRTAIAEYERLQEIFRALLNVELGRDLRGHATLFGKPIGEAALSEGQRVLVLWIVMLHSQVEHLSQAILICDEPENHLHPQALLDAIDRITRALPEVQLWIATHSLPLLSYFDPSSIFWVEDGAVEYAGTKPLKILRGLLGNDDRIGRLHDFLGLPANLAANRFAAQCLVEPGVSDKGEGDPQTGQIRNLLSTINRNHALRILDFGAGRGRLAADIRAACELDNTLSGRIDYFALEPSGVYREELLQRICELHGNDNRRLFTDVSGITNALGLRTFDVVVLCNVLHEIPGNR